MWIAGHRQLGASFRPLPFSSFRRMESVGPPCVDVGSLREQGEKEGKETPPEDAGRRDVSKKSS